MSANLDIELLRTFHAILRFGRFLAAASHLNRSPSAVSTHVRRLEELAGGPAVRARQPVGAADPAGAAVPAPDRRAAGGPRPRARRVAQTGRAAAGALRHFRGIRRQAARPPPATPRRGTAGAGLEVLTDASGRLAGRLRRGQLDLALLVQAQDETPYDGHSREIGGTQPVWVAGHGLRIDPQRPLPLALHGQGCPYRQALLEALGATGRRWRTVVSSPGATALEAAIEGGLAIGVIDRARSRPDDARAGAGGGLRRTARPPHSPGLRPGRAAAGAGRLGELIARGSGSEPLRRRALDPQAVAVCQFPAAFTHCAAMLSRSRHSRSNAWCRRRPRCARPAVAGWRYRGRGCAG